MSNWYEQARASSDNKKAALFGLLPSIEAQRTLLCIAIRHCLNK